MGNKDNDNELNIDDESSDNNSSEGNEESDRQINPLAPSVVQQSQQAAIAGKKNTALSSETQNVVSEESEFSTDGFISAKDGGKVNGKESSKLKGPTTTTKSTNYTKTVSDTGTTETTSEGTSTTTTESISTNPKVDEMLSNAQKVSQLVTALNTLRNNSVELGINYEELVYFQRMVRPLIDSTYFLALSAQGVALTAQALNGINVAKVKQVEASVELAYDFVKELDCLLQVLKCRLDTYLTLVENDGCNTL